MSEFSVKTVSSTSALTQSLHKLVETQFPYPRGGGRQGCQFTKTDTVVVFFDPPAPPSPAAPGTPAVV